MKKLWLSIILTLAAPLFAHALEHTDDGSKPYYTCQYDGGHDSYTWQLAGQDVPPSDATLCLDAEGPQYCYKVVSASGRILGNGIWCGDENGNSPYLTIKAYAQ